jgi:hypothetical protein
MRFCSRRFSFLPAVGFTHEDKSLVKPGSFFANCQAIGQCGIHAWRVWIYMTVTTYRMKNKGG